MITSTKFVLLGTGTSAGIPVIGCDCATCTSTDPRDRRSRSGAMLQFVDGDEAAHESAVVIHVSNNTYDFGPLSLGGRASMSDGLLGIVALVQPDSVTTPPLLRWEASNFDLNSSESIAAGVDGEYALLEPPLKPPRLPPP